MQCHTGGRVRGKKNKGCAPNIGLPFRIPFLSFIFFLRTNFLMWMGGWVGQAEEPRLPFRPPPPPKLLHGLI